MNLPWDRLRWAAAAAAVLCVAAGCGGDDGSDAAAQPALLSCDESMKSAFKPDDHTQVLLVKSFRQGDALLLSGSATETTPVAANDMCLVKLLVGLANPGPAGAPSTTQGIGIEAWLPTADRWNERLHLLGGAGMGGGPQTSLTSFASAPMAAPWAVAGQEGAVAATTDTGHVAGGAEFLMNADGTINRIGWEQYSVSAIYEMTRTTKALATAFFGKSARYTYWHGGSAGGRQGMKLAQAYPEEFDGIIATSPAINWMRMTMSMMWPQLVMQRDLNGVPLTMGQLTAVSNAAIRACDTVGGQHLGYLLDPDRCTYDPTTDAEVLCTADGGSNATADCVSPTQAQVMNKIWYGPTTDGSIPSPSVDAGRGSTLASEQIWYGFPRGSNLALVAGPRAFPIASGMMGLYLQDPTWAGPTFVNATGNGADRWKSLSYADFTHVINRGLALNPVFSDINTDSPDLTRFRDRGGKLITVMGSSDNLIPHYGSVNYYQRVADAMGGLAAVQAFYKLYFVPGMGHFPVNGTANATANPPIYSEAANYQALTDWVEKGVAPPDAASIASPPTPAGPSTSTGLMCAFPKVPTYVSGGVDNAASYVCRE